MNIKVSILSVDLRVKRIIIILAIESLQNVCL